MLPEIIEIILLYVEINTVKSFALSNYYFYQLISNSMWWRQRTNQDEILISYSVSAIEGCHDLSHQHYPTSVKNCTIQPWINTYQYAWEAKIKAINTY